MTKVTLLSKEDLEGELFQKIGTQCIGTRYANTNFYWTSTPSSFNFWGHAFEFNVYNAGELTGVSVANNYGIRPVLISDDFDEIVKGKKADRNGIYHVTYGEYPQNKADIQEELQDTLENGELNETGKEYTISETKYRNGKQLREYEYKGRKYVCKDGEWMKVRPIRWIVDEENRRLISEKILLSEPVNYNNNNYDSSFETSSLYNYLNNQFINEIRPSILGIQVTEEKEYAKSQELIGQYKMVKEMLEHLNGELQRIEEEMSTQSIEVPIEGHTPMSKSIPLNSSPTNTDSQ